RGRVPALQEEGRRRRAQEGQQGAGGQALRLPQDLERLRPLQGPEEQGGSQLEREEGAGAADEGGGRGGGQEHARRQPARAPRDGAAAEERGLRGPRR